MDESPSPSLSDNSPRLRQLQDILPPGMLVEPADLFDKKSGRAMTGAHHSRVSKTGARPVAAVSNLSEGEDHFDSDTQEEERILIDGKEMDTDVFGTPVTRRTIRSDRADNGSPTAVRSRPKGQQSINTQSRISHSPLGIDLSSPTGPPLTTALSLGTLEYDNESIDDDDESRWSLAALDSRMSINEEFAVQNTHSIYRASGGAHSGAENVRPIGLVESVMSTPARQNPNNASASGKLITFAAPDSVAGSPNSGPVGSDSPFGYPASAQTQIQHPLAQSLSPPSPPSFPRSLLNSSSPATRDPSTASTSRRETRSTLFDWSEPPTQHHQLSSDKKKSKAAATVTNQGNSSGASSTIQGSKASAQSPPRPRTVHGKKVDHAGDPFFQHHRGSARSVGRRTGPSGGMHMRSQSVPVVAPGGENGKRGRREPVVVTNKFGTWGVGSKGVSEDWDDDFDFGDEEETGLGNLPVVGKREESVDEERMMESMEMSTGGLAHIRVPQTIRDQQVKVVNNIGLVREFGLLIEELKGIRSRLAERDSKEEDVVASNSDSIPPQHDAFAKTELWKEVDAMIELADREVEEPLSLAEPPTPNEFDPFEEPSIPAAISAAEAHASSSLNMNTPPTQSSAWHTPNHPRRSRSRRRSVLPYENNDVFSTPTNQTSSQSLVLTSSPAGNSLSATPPTVTSSSTVSHNNVALVNMSASTSTATLPVTGRPRKDSEAMARSVIEALHRRKETTVEPSDGSSPLNLKPVPTHQKVLFDTNTLRYIVGHVQDLLKKVKAEADFDWDEEDEEEEDEVARSIQPKRRRESAGDEDRRRVSGGASSVGEGRSTLERLFRNSGGAGRSTTTGTRLEFVDERASRGGHGLQVEEEETEEEDVMDMT
jgi:hypothetical protein